MHLGQEKLDDGWPESGEKYSELFLELVVATLNPKLRTPKSLRSEKIES